MVSLLLNDHCTVYIRYSEIFKANWISKDQHSQNKLHITQLVNFKSGSSAAALIVFFQLPSFRAQHVSSLSSRGNHHLKDVFGASVGPAWWEIAWENRMLSFYQKLWLESEQFVPSFTSAKVWCWCWRWIQISRLVTTQSDVCKNLSLRVQSSTL